MRKILISLFILMCIVTGCKNSNNNDKIAVAIKYGTLTRTGATIIITDNSGNNNTYGTEYSIEKKENGKWKELNTLIKAVWNYKGYHVDSNNKLEFEINWSDLYGLLENGTYRLIKKVNNKNIYAEFKLDDDLDKFKIVTIEDKFCNKKSKLYYSGDINVYTYCLNNISVVENGVNVELKDYLNNSSVSNTIDYIISKLEYEVGYWDGGTVIYKDGGSKKYSNNGLSLLKCNTLDDNHDIYIGPANMEYENDMCK